MTIPTSEKKMTFREFFNAVIEADISEEINTFAEAEIAKLDKTNEARKGKKSKEALANEPLKMAILQYIVEHPNEHFLQTELGEALGISPNKAGALARQVAEAGQIKSERVKISKVGERTVYSVLDEDEEPTDAE